MPSCPPPFLDDAPYPSHQGNIYGRLCSNVLPLASPNTTCCLPCPVQNYVLRHSSLNALHVNDMVNVIGFVIGIFILLCFAVLPQNVTSRSLLAISVVLSQVALNFCLILPLFALPEIQCANDITPANKTSNPLCGVQGSLHVFAGHSLAFLVMCRTIHLHIQICWSHLHVNRVVGIILNVIGWTVPAIMLGLVFVVADIAYTISDHCSIRVDWIARLLIIPLIVEISLALFVQILTFGYCVNVYLKSLSEPPPPTSDIFEGGPVSINSFHSTRYPYRKAFARVRKVLMLQWRAWAQCLSLIFIGTLFSTAYYFLSKKYMSLQEGLIPGNTPDPRVISWVECLLLHSGNASPCLDLAAEFIANQELLLVAEFSISTVWIWVTLFFFRIRFFPAWRKVIRKVLGMRENPNDRPKEDSFRKSSLTPPDNGGLVIHLHTPSKEFLENQSQGNTPQLPPIGFRSPSDSSSIAAHEIDDEQLPQQESGVKRSLSNPFKRAKMKQPSVEDILAMKRRNEFEDEGLGYPGVQPVILSGNSRIVYDV